MKHIITAAMLILASPAFASSAAEWDCGNGATAISNRGELSFSIAKQPRKGALRWDFRDLDNPKVWLNGKLCKQSN